MKNAQRLVITGLFLLAAAVAQAANCPFTYYTGPGSTTMAANGGYGQFTVQVPAGCAWTALPFNPWIRITSRNAGNGPGVITFAAAANPARGGRAGDIFIQATSPGPSGSNIRGRHHILQR